MANAKANTPKGNNSMTAWRDSMGYSPKDAADALGMTLADYTEYEAAPEAPKYIRLAMQALALGLADDGGPDSGE